MFETGGGVGTQKSFKAVAVARGGPSLWPLPEETRDGFLSNKPGNQGEVVEQPGVVLRSGLLPGCGGREGEGGAAPLVPPPTHQRQLHLQKTHQVPRSRA